MMSSKQHAWFHSLCVAKCTCQRGKHAESWSIQWDYVLSWHLPLYSSVSQAHPDFLSTNLPQCSGKPPYEKFTPIPPPNPAKIAPPCFWLHPFVYFLYIRGTRTLSWIPLTSTVLGTLPGYSNVLTWNKIHFSKLMNTCLPLWRSVQYSSEYTTHFEILETCTFTFIYSVTCQSFRRQEIFWDVCKIYTQKAVVICIISVP